MSRLSDALKNISYTFSANIIILLISGVLTLVVPKLLGPEEYGYWQLYVFYMSYVGLFHLGWCDGVYLRYGGRNYKQLDKPKFVTQFWLLFLMECILGTIVIFATSMLQDGNKEFVLIMTVIYGLVINPRYFLLFTLQGTNLIKEYAKIIILDRVVYCAATAVVLLCGGRDFKLLIYADIFARIVSMIYAVIICKEIVFGKPTPLKPALAEAKKNISAGSKLMFANIAGNLIVGVVRLGIEKQWSIEVFGKISLTLSISSMLLTFISAIAMVLFPMLRRASQDAINDIYASLRTCLMLILLGVMVLYYPVKEGLSLWLPQYAESLKYMALLFPVCIFESKVSMLTNTYLKTVRKEKWILYVNLVSFLLSITFTIITVFVMQNLTVAIVAIVILLAFKSILAEYMLSKVININILKDTLYELVLVVGFMIFSWEIHSWISTVLYALLYILYLFLKKEDIKQAVVTIKRFA